MKHPMKCFKYSNVSKHDFEIKTANAMFHFVLNCVLLYHLHLFPVVFIVKSGIHQEKVDKEKKWTSLIEKLGFFLKEVELLDIFLFRSLFQYCMTWHLEAHPNHLIQRNLVVTLYSFKF